MSSTNKKILAGVVAFSILNVLLFVFYGSLVEWGKGMMQVSQPWYAVHLNNGQVYFGHLAKVTPETITISDVHYLQAANAIQSENASTTEFQINASGQQVYNILQRGGDNFLTTDHRLSINRSTVLFWERLNTSAAIVSAIENLYKNK